MPPSGDDAPVGTGRAVILDRDGVLVIPRFDAGRSYAPRSLEDLRFYADATAGVEALKQAGFRVIVATNQPDVGAGLVARTTVEAMHARLRASMPVDDIEVCYETREQASERRKPGAGMLFEAAQKWCFDLSASYMVGDRWSDIEAGRRAGCTGVFIDHGYTAETGPTDQAATVTTFGDAVNWILSNEGSQKRNRQPCHEPK